MKVTTKQPKTLSFRSPQMKTFANILVNTMFVSVIHATVWFAITFYAYLQTRSVLVTGVLGGVYLTVTVATGIWFGSLVDNHKKKTVMQWSNIISLAIYVACLLFYLLIDHTVFQSQTSPLLWAFIVMLLCGSVVGNIRTIALPTLVTILVPEEKRDRANGLVGSIVGTAFLVTSVISGFLVAKGGMLYILLLALVVMVAVIMHLAFITIPEKGVVHLEDQTSKVDLRGTFRLIQGVPGLLALILFACFNNLLGGVFMALMDAYGLSLMSVQAWGLLWGVLSSGFIIGGLIVSKVGLGKNPIRSLLLANLVMWIITILFPIHSSITPLVVGMAVYMCIVPIAEAAEHTVLQKVVPLERQGRVFGFAQSIEQATSPLMAFIIGPLAQFFFIPYMTDGTGAQTIGTWFGTGANRGIALLFIVTGIIGVLVTVLALYSKYYRQLSAHYQDV